MKKFFLILAAVAMVLPGCKKIEESIDALSNRIDKLEQETIPTIDEQIAAINLSLDALEAMDKELKGYIDGLQATADNLQEQINATNTKIDEVKTALQGEINAAKEEVLAQLEDTKTKLEAELATINATIETLKAKDAELDQKIADLKSYVDTELGKTTDWVNATFATLEQLNALSSEVAALKSLVDANKAEATANLANAISNLETSLKKWVGEQLSNYYTIAEIDAKIAALEKAIADGDSALQQQLNELKSQLESAKKELTEAYKKAIEEAITINNGVINAKIASEIAAVNKRIDSEVAAINAKIANIESRLDALEDKVDDLADKITGNLSISFDIEEDTALIAGSTIKINYTITNSSSECHIATIAQNGWSAVVTKSSDKEGYITVTSPKPLTNSPIIVLVSNSVTTIMRTLSFVHGFASIETDSYSVSFDATTLDINVQSNLDYTIEIPSSASSWISVKSVTTRATVRNDVITLTVAENTDASARTATIGLLYDGITVGNIKVYQQSQIIANNEIAYTTTDNSVLTLSSVIAFGSKIVSNTYNNGRGLIVCESDITTIGASAFNGCSNLQTIKLPDSITSIGNYAFYYCTSLTSITIPDSVTSIGYYAFYDCTSLTSVTIPNSVTSIGGSAFWNCTSLTSVTIGNSVTSIGDLAFYCCSSLTRVDITDLSAWCKIKFDYYDANPLCYGAKLYLNGSELTNITIPSDITEIKDYTFDGCTSLTSVTIPDSVTSIGERAFYRCTSLTSVTIPNSVTSIGNYAFYYCTSLKEVYCKPTTPPSLGNSALPTNNASLTIYVPTDSVDAYKAKDGWKDYAFFITEYVF